jgi:hypothetical protein
MQWQAQQEFPICPTPDDPSSCNVYRELHFPEGMYERIEEFWEERAEHVPEEPIAHPELFETGDDRH